MTETVSLSHVTFRTGYLDKALLNLDEVLDIAVADLQDVDFDTLVGTGFSGALVVPALALRLGKRFLLVRKPDDDSHHSGRVIGDIGQRWVFLDDFSATGKTKRRVVDTIELAITGESRWTGLNLETKHVGNYYYALDANKRFQTEV